MQKVIFNMEPFTCPCPKEFLNTIEHRPPEGGRYPILKA